MTKQMQIAICVAIAVVIVILIGAFVMMKGSSSPTDEVMAPKQEESSASSQTSGSLKSLFGTGKNTTCDIVYPDGAGNGTVYVSGNKMRGLFNMTVEGKTMESNVIYDGQYSYIWTGAQGTKYKIDPTAATPAPTGQNQGADLDKQVDMSCSNWSVDNSKFTPPADVKFTDLTESMMMMQKQTGSSTAPSTTKSYCDAIADPQAKAACMNAGY